MPVLLEQLAKVIFIKIDPDKCESCGVALTLAHGAIVEEYGWTPSHLRVIT